MNRGIRKGKGIALEYEKIKQREREAERENEIQKERLRLIAEGKISEGGNGSSSVSAVGSGTEGNLSRMIRFLPKFNDRDPDIFFSLFEGIVVGVTLTVHCYSRLFSRGEHRMPLSRYQLQSARIISALKKPYCGPLNRFRNIIDSVLGTGKKLTGKPILKLQEILLVFLIVGFPH